MSTHGSTESPLLGVNIDHVATLRQARGIDFPDPTDIALLAEKAGADYITLHLREDRRHIQDFDVAHMHRRLTTYMNLEIAVTREMLDIAARVKPRDVCFVPEKRQELTTEGGLNVCEQKQRIGDACKELEDAGIRVSLFIDADPEQIDAAKEIGARTVEIHTGHYANAAAADKNSEANKLLSAFQYAKDLGLIVNAGHGLNYENVHPIAASSAVSEFNIGHSIISRALYVGIEKAVHDMKRILTEARQVSVR